MKMEDDSLKKLYQSYVASKILIDRNCCLSKKALIGFFDSSVPYRKKSQIIDHVSMCRYCAEEFNLLLEIQRNKDLLFIEMEDTAVPVLQSNIFISKRRRFWGKYAYVLLGFALSISSLFFLISEKEPSRSYRTREMKVSIINPGAIHFFPSPLIFQWKPYPSAEYYVLELFDDTLLPIWTSPLIYGSQLPLPGELVLQFENRKYYFWMITAFSKSESIAESELIQLIILGK